MSDLDDRGVCVCVCVCVEECWEITFSVSAVQASFLSRQIALLRELLLGWQSHLSPSFSLSHPTCLFSVNLCAQYKLSDAELLRLGGEDLAF